MARPTVTVLLIGGEDAARDVAAGLLRRTFHAWLGGAWVDSTFLEEGDLDATLLFGYRISIRDGGGG